MVPFGRGRRIAPAWLSSLVIALAVPTARADGDRSQVDSPWLDQGATLPLGSATVTSADPTPDPGEPSAEVTASVRRPSALKKYGSLAGILGVYAAASTYMYFAWYYDQPGKSFTWGGDGYFGADTYAGGADKLGHTWANLMWSRLTGDILLAGGWERWKAALIAPGITLGLFTLVEVKDGVFYEFSYGDAIGNVLGAGLSGLMIRYPYVDELLDFRVEYWPSQEYIDLWNGHRPPVDPERPHQVTLNIAEDYSGQRYLFALHLGALPGLRDQTWARLVDVAVGYETRGYKPDPIEPDVDRTRHLFVGLSLNAQGLFDLALSGRRSKAARVGHAVTHEVFEFFNIPFTSAAIAGTTSTRSP
jgi:hypothetical protein